MDSAPVHAAFWSRLLFGSTAALFAFLLVVPGAPAQPIFEGNVIDDPAGDLMLNLAQTLDAGTMPGHDGFDVLGLSILEDPSHVHFRVHVADLESETGSRSMIDFDVGDKRYRLTLTATTDDEGGFFGFFSEGARDGDLRFVKQVRAYGAPAEGMVWAAVDRDDLSPGSGRKLLAGDRLDNLRVTSGGGQYPAWWHDTAPDAGADAGVSYAMEWVHQAGPESLLLEASHPFRTSNGEATTYRYDVRVTNKAAEPALLSLSLARLPDLWDVTLPGTELSMPAGRTLEFPVVVTVPFNHEHGTAESFVLHAHDAATDAWGEVELGVQFLAIPHPAGHHDTVYFHSHGWSAGASVINPALGGTTGWLGFNTLQDDPSDGGAALPMWGAMVNDAMQYNLRACLDPALSMGLDFDLERSGTALIPIQAQRPMDGAVVEGVLRLIDVEDVSDASCSFATGDEGVLATFASAAMDMGTGASHTFEAAIIPTALADQVIHDGTQTLVMQLTLTADAVSAPATAPLLLPGGSMQLPLVDYHEPLPALGFSAPTVDAQNAAGTDQAAFIAEPASQDTPGVGAASLVGALAVAGALRRRSD